MKNNNYLFLFGIVTFSIISTYLGYKFIEYRNLNFDNIRQLENKKVKEKALQRLIKKQWLIEGTYISPNILLEDLSRTKTSLNEIIQNKKLILMFNETDCNVCIRQELRLIEELISNPDELVIIASYKKSRDLFIFLESLNMKIPSFRLSENERLKLPKLFDNQESPYAFWLDPIDFKIRACHVADSGFEDISRLFYNVVNDQLMSLSNGQIVMNR